LGDTPLTVTPQHREGIRKGKGGGGHGEPSGQEPSKLRPNLESVRGAVAWIKPKVSGVLFSGSWASPREKAKGDHTVGVHQIPTDEIWAWRKVQERWGQARAGNLGGGGNKIGRLNYGGASL